jgi:hypothetical protein
MSTLSFHSFISLLSIGSGEINSTIRMYGLLLYACSFSHQPVTGPTIPGSSKEVREPHQIMGIGGLEVRWAFRREQGTLKKEQVSLSKRLSYHDGRPSLLNVSEIHLARRSVFYPAPLLEVQSLAASIVLRAISSGGLFCLCSLWPCI